MNVSPSVSIARNELQYRATRAGGPGGQHVNTSSTRIELLWDLTNSRAVTDEQRERIRTRLAARLDADGMVRVVASDRRSQQQNR
ncbi:MAG TPA: peptide chain release factor-like protein, partial [Gemmatimonadaceae bacterium]